MSQSDELDKILEQLQYGTIMSDNQEPQLTNNRNIAKQALEQHYAKLMLEATIEAEIKGLNDYWKQCRMLRVEPTTIGLGRRITELKANKDKGDSRNE